MSRPDGTRPRRRGLSENIDDERSQGYHGTRDGNPYRGGRTDAGVLRLHLVGLHIDDIVLLKIVVGRIHDVRVIQVERIDLLAAFPVFTDQFHPVAHAIDGQVASLCQRL